MYGMDENVTLGHPYILRPFLPDLSGSQIAVSCGAYRFLHTGEHRSQPTIVDVWFVSFPMPELFLHYRASRCRCQSTIPYILNSVGSIFARCIFPLFAHSPAFLELFSVLYATRFATMPDSLGACGLDVDIHLQNKPTSSD